MRNQNNVPDIYFIFILCMAWKCLQVFVFVYGLYLYNGCICIWLYLYMACIPKQCWHSWSEVNLFPIPYRRCRRYCWWCWHAAGAGHLLIYMQGLQVFASVCIWLVFGRWHIVGLLTVFCLIGLLLFVIIIILSQVEVLSEVRTLKAKTDVIMEEARFALLTWFLLVPAPYVLYDFIYWPRIYPLWLSSCWFLLPMCCTGWL